MGVGLPVQSPALGLQLIEGPRKYSDLWWPGVDFFKYPQRILKYMYLNTSISASSNILEYIFPVRTQR